MFVSFSPPSLFSTSSTPLSSSSAIFLSLLLPPHPSSCSSPSYPFNLPLILSPSPPPPFYCCPVPSPPFPLFFFFLIFNPPPPLIFLSCAYSSLSFSSFAPLFFFSFCSFFIFFFLLYLFLLFLIFLFLLSPSSSFFYPFTPSFSILSSLSYSHSFPPSLYTSLFCFSPSSSYHSSTHLIFLSYLHPAPSLYS